MKSQYDMFAGYNAWANACIYDAAALLSDADYRADRGAFFKSVHGTLNHMLVTDRIWMKRFTGQGEATNQLDAILYEDFAVLRQAREAEDARIVSYLHGLSEKDLSAPFRYQRASVPDWYEQELAPALAHFFNHQTHHRGQIHGLLTSLTGSAPELDLLFYQRLQGIGGMRKVG